MIYIIIYIDIITSDNLTNSSYKIARTMNPICLYIEYNIVKYHSINYVYINCNSLVYL